MAIYRCVSIGFWSDRKVLSKFSPEDKYFFLYLLTNEKTTISGCYEFNLEDASIDLGYNVEAIKKLLTRMETYHKVIKTYMIDETHIEVLVLNWKKYNWNSSKKTIQAIKYSVDKIMCEEFRKYVLNEMRAFDKSGEEVKPRDTVVAETAVQKKIQRQTESYTDGWPEEQEVSKYVEEKGYLLNPRSFWFYYEGKGWKDSDGNPIGDWKKLLDACEKSGKFRRLNA